MLSSEETAAVHDGDYRKGDFADEEEIAIVWIGNLSAVYCLFREKCSGKYKAAGRKNR